MSRGLFVLIGVVCFVGCSSRAGATLSAPRVAASSRSLDVVFVFVRDWGAKEDVQLNMVRTDGQRADRQRSY